jgi:hypothetical protein
MKFKQFLKESNEGRTLIIVDIQPTYKSFLTFKLSHFIDFLKESNYKTYLYLYNGPEMGFENENEIKQWLIESCDYDEMEEVEDKLETFDFYEKGYTFFRNSMDRGDSEEDTIKLIKLMLKKKIYDSRDLEESDWEDLGIEDLGRDNLYIPDVLDELKKYNNIDICGGGKNQCLKEVEICLDVLNKPYNQIKKFIY